jgi:TolB-like protein
MYAIRMLAAVCLVAVLLGSIGCNCRSCIVAYDPVHKCVRRDADLIETSYNAVDCLLARTPRTDPNRRILVATTVNLDDLTHTSTFGRVIQEFFATRLAHRGYSVVHMTVRHGSVLINPEGEFLLSRDMKELAEDYNAASVLVSTYTWALDKIYISLKLVDAPTGEVVAAVDYTVPQGPRTRRMFGKP